MPGRPVAIVGHSCYQCNNLIGIDCGLQRFHAAVVEIATNCFVGHIARWTGLHAVDRKNTAGAVVAAVLGVVVGLVVVCTRVSSVAEALACSNQSRIS